MISDVLDENYRLHVSRRTILERYIQFNNRPRKLLIFEDRFDFIKTLLGKFMFFLYKNDFTHALLSLFEKYCWNFHD